MSFLFSLHSYTHQSTTEDSNLVSHRAHISQLTVLQANRLRASSRLLARTAFQLNCQEIRPLSVAVRSLAIMSVNEVLHFSTHARAWPLNIQVGILLHTNNHVTLRLTSHMYIRAVLIKWVFRRTRNPPINLSRM
jgi:hypothetical protein